MDYVDLNKLWHETLFDVNLRGHILNSRVGYCKEIIGFQTTLTYPLHNILFAPKRKFSLAYACAEMLWYLSGTGSIKMIQAYAPQYEKFAEDGWAYGAYGHRWNHNPGFVNAKASLIEGLTRQDCEIDIENQLSALVHLLRADPNTRQAIMTMWDSGDLIHAIARDHKDLPCTLSLMFFVRDNRLHLVATMRSNDAWLGLPYDIFCFTTLQRIIAAELGLELGAYIHQAGSEHIYEKNQEKIDEILRIESESKWSGEGAILLYPYPLNWNHKRRDYDLQHNVKAALSLEKEIRKATMDEHCLAKGIAGNQKAWKEIDPLFKDLVLGCATKWTHVPNDWFDNPLYASCQRYTENLNEA